MAKRLLITADDFGIHDVIDQGIYQCIDAGAIDCVDVMVTHASSRSRIKKLKKYLEDHHPTIKIGLHLSLTSGAPLYRESQKYLKEMTRYSENGKLVFKYHKPEKIIPKIYRLQEDIFFELEYEMLAQYERFIEIIGDKPAHISSHEGVYQATKPLYSMYRNFCLSKSIHMRCPTLLGLDDSMKWGGDPEQNMLPKAMVIINNGRIIWKWMKNEIKPVFLKDLKNGLDSTEYHIEHFFNQYDDGKDQHHLLKRLMDKLIRTNNNASYEMVVHPVTYTSPSDYKDMPLGIKTNKKLFNKRRAETFALTQQTLGNTNRTLREYLEDNQVNRYWG